MTKPQEILVNFAREDLTENNFELVFVNTARQLRGLPRADISATDKHRDDEDPENLEGLRRSIHTYCEVHGITLETANTCQQNIRYVLSYYGKNPDNDNRILLALNEQIKRIRLKLEKNREGSLRYVTWAENPTDEIYFHLTNILVGGLREMTECLNCYKLVVKKIKIQKFCSNNRKCHDNYHNQRPMRKWWYGLSLKEREDYLEKKRKELESISPKEKEKIKARARAQPNLMGWGDTSNFILNMIFNRPQPPFLSG